MITYSFINVPFSLSSKRIINSWIKSVISDNSSFIGDINYIFCNDQYLLDINNKFLGHNYYTDIITFDNSSIYMEEHPSAKSKNYISGDIFISLDSVKSNASLYGVSYINELYRVIIHGILHLLGFDDLTPDDFNKMKSLENHYLSKLPIYDN